MTARSRTNDPIIDAIQAYRDGDAAFCAVKEANWPEHGGEEGVVAKTYGPPLDALNDWEQPIETREGALAALRFIHAENKMTACLDFIDPLLERTIAYFEQERTPFTTEDPVAFNVRLKALASELTDMVDVMNRELGAENSASFWVAEIWPRKGLSLKQVDKRPRKQVAS